eukprot:366331-Chlamydomonas_euryale.AAC.29
MQRRRQLLQRRRVCAQRKRAMADCGGIGCARTAAGRRRRVRGCRGRGGVSAATPYVTSAAVRA